MYIKLNHRCDKASEIGVTRLATVRCPTGLAFDIERQTCDWKTNVKNCDQLESKRYIQISIWLNGVPFVFCPTRTGARNPAWSKSRAPAGWPLTWTNRPATGRAKSPTVTSSRVSRCIDQGEPVYSVSISVVLFPRNAFHTFFRSFCEKNISEKKKRYKTQMSDSFWNCFKLFSMSMLYEKRREKTSRLFSIDKEIWIFFFKDFLYNARSWKEHLIEKIVFIRSPVENDEKFFKKMYGEARLFRRLAT